MTFILRTIEIMSFATTLILLIALPFEYIQCADYCSRYEKGKVECIPCSDVCAWAQQPCNMSHHFCPNQCGNSIPASECLDVCNHNCLNGRCEYRNGLMDLACTGCEPEFAGKVCQEVCPFQCLECNQFDGTCLACKENYTGPNCTEASETIDVTFASSPSTDINIRNCSDNCMTCDVTSGVCKQCRKGRYGLTCQHECIHCNLSRCTDGELCLECMRDLSCETSTLSTQPAAENFQEAEPKDNMPVIYGLSTALILTLCSVCICLVMWKCCKSRYRVRALQRDNTITGDRKNGRGSTGMLTTNGGYTYINDNDIELNFNQDITTCQPLWHQSYESVGNMSLVAGETGSTSTVSSTIFGNLFELNMVPRERNQFNEEERQLTHNHCMECQFSDGNSLGTSKYLSPVLCGRNTN